MVVRRTRWRHLIRLFVLDITNRVIFGGSRKPLRFPIFDIGFLLWSCAVLVLRMVGGLSVAGCLFERSGTHARAIGPILMKNAQRLLLATCRMDCQNRVAVVILIRVVLSFFIRQAHAGQVVSQMVSIRVGGTVSSEHVLEVLKKTACILWHGIPDLLTLKTCVIQGFDGLFSHYPLSKNAYYNGRWRH